jgi:hypothetical protein
VKNFNWGTGIFIFLAIFLLACAAFIIFALNQDVNLVQGDYYDKGTNYTRQMETDSRSATYQSQFTFSDEKDSVRIGFPAELKGKIDSGSIVFFRPSDMNLDLRYPIQPAMNEFVTDKLKFVAGRYIVQVTWFSDGIDYGVKKEIEIRGK